MTELKGKIIRNINTPNVGGLVISIKTHEGSGMFRGIVKWVPLNSEEALEEVEVIDKDFNISKEQFFKEFEVLTNPDTISCFSESIWKRMQDPYEED
jgi:hypothetical protein